MLVHHKLLWNEIQDVIARVDAEACKTKVSKEKTMRGKLLYSPEDMNTAFKLNFETLGWKQRRNTFWVTEDEKVMRAVYSLPTEEQKEAIRAPGASRSCRTTRRIS